MDKQSVVLTPITPENFHEKFKNDVHQLTPHKNAPDCPLTQNAGYHYGSMSKCDVSTTLREFSISVTGGHECGVCGKCPVRTYLESH